MRLPVVRLALNPTRQCGFDKLFIKWMRNKQVCICVLLAEVVKPAYEFSLLGKGPVRCLFNESHKMRKGIFPQAFVEQVTEASIFIPSRNG
jgi:hypothetical protein